MNEDRITTLAYRAAKDGRRRWASVSMSDYMGDAFLEAAERGLYDVDLSELSDEEISEWEKNALRLMRNAVQRSARRAKAVESGYKIEDEQFYSLARLRELTEHLFHSGLTPEPPQGRAESVSKPRGNPAEAGTWLASLLDVQAGLMRLPDKHASALWHRLGQHGALSDDEYVLRGYETSVASLRRKQTAALKALQRLLGDGNPWNHGPTPKPVYQEI